MNRYNQSREAISKSPLNQQAAIEFADKQNTSIIKDCELKWMIQQKPLIFSKKQCIIDLGEAEANKLFQLIDTFDTKYNGKYNKSILGALAWNGVISRYAQFMKFLHQKYENKNKPSNSGDDEKKNDTDNTEIIKDAEDALLQFGSTLGRVVSYRALALTKSEFESVQFLNEIVPTGQLRASLKEMKQIVDTQGITRITVARLYINHLSKWIGLDPSLSLHDDCETALTIAQTYMSEQQEKYVYLFEMNVPKIMSIGFKVVDVQNKAGLVDEKFADRKNRKSGKQSDRWFDHKGVWFDAYDERTERQLLYAIPFFKERCQKITVYRTKKELLERIEGFRKSQLEKKSKCDEENVSDVDKEIEMLKKQKDELKQKLQDKSQENDQ